MPERWQPITKTGEFLRSFGFGVGKVKKILPRIIRATVRCTGQAHVTKVTRWFDTARCLLMPSWRSRSLGTRPDWITRALESAPDRRHREVEDAGRVQRAKNEGKPIGMDGGGKNQRKFQGRN